MNKFFSVQITFILGGRTKKFMKKVVGFSEKSTSKTLSKIVHKNTFLMKEKTIVLPRKVNLNHHDILAIPIKWCRISHYVKKKKLIQKAASDPLVNHKKVNNKRDMNHEDRKVCIKIEHEKMHKSSVQKQSKKKF